MFFNRKLGYTFIDQAVVSASNFILGILTARLLGLTDFGVFTIIWLSIYFVQSIQNAAISSPLMTIGRKNKRRRLEDFAGVFITLQIAFSIMSSFIVAIIAYVFVGDAAEPGYFIFLTTYLYSFISLINDFTRKYNYTIYQNSVVLKMDVVRYMILFFIIYLLIYIESVTIGSVYLAMLLAALVPMVIFSGAIPRISFNIVKIIAFARRSRKLSVWLTASAVMQWTSGNFFLIVAGIVAGPVAIGALRSAQNLIGFSNVIYQVADSYAIPRAAEIYKTDGRCYLDKFLIKVLVSCVVVVFIPASIVFIYSDALMNLIFGLEFRQYGFLLQIFSILSVFKAASLVLRYWALTLEQGRLIFNSYLGASLLTMFLSYPLVIYYEIFGAALGMLFVQIYLMCVMLKQIISGSKSLFISV